LRSKGVEAVVDVRAEAAEQAGAAQLYSEDLNSGQTIAGVKIVNPLMTE
jgi:predicted nucleic acid-binding protein